MYMYRRDHGLGMYELSWHRFRRAGMRSCSVEKIRI